MNRSLTNVLFGGIGTIAPSEATKIEGTITNTNVDEAVEALTNADRVILVSETPKFLRQVQTSNIYRLSDTA